MEAILSMGNSIGEKICYYRQLKKMTQEEFASRIGVTPQAVSKWERDNGLPDIMVLSGIASVLGVSADTLLGRDVPLLLLQFLKNMDHILDRFAFLELFLQSAFKFQI